MVVLATSGDVWTGSLLANQVPGPLQGPRDGSPSSRNNFFLFVLQSFPEIAGYDSAKLR